MDISKVWCFQDPLKALRHHLFTGIWAIVQQGLNFTKIKCQAGEKPKESAASSSVHHHHPYRALELYRAELSPCFWRQSASCARFMNHKNYRALTNLPVQSVEDQRGRNTEQSPRTRDTSSCLTSLQFVKYLADVPSLPDLSQQAISSCEATAPLRSV